VVVVYDNHWHCSCVEFKRQMSKTQLWWFKFGIGGLCGNVNKGLDESSVVHRTPTNYIKFVNQLIVDWTLLY